MRRYVIDIIILAINSIQATSRLAFNITIKKTINKKEKYADAIIELSNCY
jgi:hypothetical protein